MQNILQKVRIQKAKLSLKLGIDIDDLNHGDGYSCDKCGIQQFARVRAQFVR